MSTLKEKSQAILNEKNEKILPENIKAGVQIFDIVGTMEASISSGAKIFETVEEMNTSTNNTEGDLAIVYKSTIGNAQANSVFQVAKFPNTVVLPEAFADWCELLYVPADDSNIYMEANGMLSADSYNWECYIDDKHISIYYESSDGITYTRVDGGDELVDFGINIRYDNSDYWNNAIGYFIQIPSSDFGGIYKNEFVENLDYISFPMLTDVPEISENFSAITIENKFSNKYSVEKIVNLINKIRTENSKLVGNECTLYINTDNKLVCVWGNTKYNNKINDQKYVNSVNPDTRKPTSELSNYGQGFSTESEILGIYSYTLDLENMTYVEASLDYTANIYTPRAGYDYYHLITNGANVASVAYMFTLESENFLDDYSTYTQYFQAYKDGSISIINISITPSRNYWETAWVTAPTQLSTTADYAYEKEFYGKNGIEEGTLQNAENLSIDGMVVRATLWDKLSTLTLNPSITSLDNAFDGYDGTTIPNIDTSNITRMMSTFYACPNLVTIPKLTTGKVTVFAYTFNGCTSLTTVPELDTSSCTTTQYMFSICSSLVTVPQFNLGKVTNIISMFQSCPLLSDTSLNNILASLTSAKSYTGTKTLKQAGLTSEQATRCTTLSNYSAFTAAGWTTGY